MSSIVRVRHDLLTNHKNQPDGSVWRSGILRSLEYQVRKTWLIYVRARFSFFPIEVDIGYFREKLKQRLPDTFDISFVQSNSNQWGSEAFSDGLDRLLCISRERP
jgi:hypothetical protein